MKRMFKAAAVAAIAALALSGCVKHEPFGRRTNGHEGDGNGGGRTEETLNLTQRTDWALTYSGRATRNYDNGTQAVVETFRLAYNGSSYVLPLIISDENLRTVYDNKLLDFFSYEVELLQNDAKASPTVPLSELGVYTSRVKDVDFNRHMHGTWIAYLVELDSQLALTGQYAENTFTIEEEAPTPAFNKWIGFWHVGNGYNGFDIEVSDADANYLYYIDGWEQGESVIQPMDGDRDWLYARFADGKLIFYAQFLTTEDYNNITVDEVFAGTYLTPSSATTGDLDWEGVDYEDPIAFTAESSNSEVVLTPCTVPFDNGYSYTYHSMRFSRLWFTDNGETVNWAYYNEAGVPSFSPNVVTMTRVTRAETRAASPAVRRQTRGTVHRDQLRPVRTTRARKAARAL